MKTFIAVLFLAACLILCTHGYPGAPRDTLDSEESSEEKNLDAIIVPSGMKNRFINPIVDLSDMSDGQDSSEGLGLFGGSPWANSFEPSFTSNWFSGILKKFSESFNKVWPGLDQGGIPWGMIPEGANTTSTTKVINDHLVTINETTYMDGDEANGVLIRVRVIDVKPKNETILATESEVDTEVTTLPTDTVTNTVATEEKSIPSRSVETVEDFNNEIPNQTDSLTA